MVPLAIALVPLPSLILPMVVAAVLVFIVSSLVHMVLPYHKGDMKGLPNEETARAALQNLAPGQYNIPHLTDMKAMKEPAVLKKYTDGPVAVLTVLPSRPINMGKFLGQWFLYCLAVSFATAYLTGRVVGPGAEYLQVFRVAGTVAWMAYASAHIATGIWQGRPWSTVVKDVFDGFLFCLVTAGAFAGFWPE